MKQQFPSLKDTKLISINVAFSKAQKKFPSSTSVELFVEYNDRRYMYVFQSLGLNEKPKITHDFFEQILYNDGIMAPHVKYNDVIYKLSIIADVTIDIGDLTIEL